MSEEIPKKGKAAVVVNEGPEFRVEVQEVDVPEPKDDEVLLRLNATGLCMSDVHFMMNDWAVPPMSHFGTTCAGHEGAGVVVKVGSKVTVSSKNNSTINKEPTFADCAAVRIILPFPCGSYSPHTIFPLSGKRSEDEQSTQRSSS
ncbi:hypothetical protein LTR22_020394 [Elasticomyces elasticus]|nr:hypothetical protein LTR22_020394 [Elasticomyces elasticus]